MTASTGPRRGNASDGTSSRTFTYDDAGNMRTNSRVGTLTYPAPGPRMRF